MGHAGKALVGLAACLGIWSATTLAASATPPPKPVPPRPPSWAYPGNPQPPPGAPKPKPDPRPYTVPGSKLMFTRAQLNLFNPPDWHPQDHPAMPPLIAHGRPPAVNACGYCHLPSGQGRPENATLAGLPVRYFIQQMADFKRGARVSSVAHRAPADNMVANAKAISPREVAVAAAYFARIKPHQPLTVVETDTVPVTVEKSWILAMVPGGRREPINGRMIETPSDLERFEKRDGRTPITVYVPRGAIARGRAIATGRTGRAEVACVSCHGQRLEGEGDIPGLKGRLPTSLVRQIYDFRSGSRHGVNAPPMRTVAVALNQRDIVDVIAYVASLK